MWGVLSFTNVFEVVFHLQNIWGRLSFTKILEVIFHLQKYLKSSSIYKEIRHLIFANIFEVVFHFPWNRDHLPFYNKNWPDWPNWLFIGVRSQYILTYFQGQSQFILTFFQKPTCCAYMFYDKIYKIGYYSGFNSFLRDQIWANGGNFRVSSKDEEGW